MNLLDYNQLDVISFVHNSKPGCFGLEHLNAFIPAN